MPRNRANTVCDVIPGQQIDKAGLPKFKAIALPSGLVMYTKMNPVFARCAPTARDREPDPWPTHS